MRKIALLFLALPLLLGSGCVYYNTFFLAKKNYNGAEKLRLMSTSDELPANAKSKYDIAVEKSSKVLAYYPESKWVDDALFLLGMCFYRTGEYVKAIRKFDELKEAFPESDYIPEANYWRTLCVYETGEFETALSTLQEMAKGGSYAERSAFMIAELFYKQEDFISAKDAYLSYVDAYPKGSYWSLAHLRLANIDFVDGNYTACIDEVGLVSEKEVTPAEFFGAQMLSGEALTELDSLDAALKHYLALRKNEDFYSRWPEVDLRIGDVHYLMADTTSAIDVWSGVCTDFPRTENAAWGWFKRGDLHLDFGIIAVAKAEFDSAAAQVSQGKVKELALQKSASIAKLQKFKDLLTSAPDSLDVDVVGTELALAEMFLTELNQPDSALSEYNYIVENYPDDTLAPKAAYGIGWIYAFNKKERAKADSAFASLLKQYPESDYAVGAADYFVGRGAALDSLGVKTVAYYFVRAEELLLTYNKIDSAMAYYRLVSENYPRSRFRPKAIAAMAYIGENITFDYAEAGSLYQFLSDSFPGTDYASFAQVHLGEAAPKIDVDRPPEYAESLMVDSIATEGEELVQADEKNNAKPTRGGIIDPLTGKEIPRAPHPKYPVELRYPQAEWKSKLQGRVVRLKIRIDPFGEVEEVELLAGCGNDIIDRAAIAGVKDTEWNPDDIPVEQLGGWFYFEVRVNKPTLTINRSR